jgi:tetratricopeptide (TPR) repeat protein
MDKEVAFIEKIDYLYEIQRYHQVVELGMKYLYTEHEFKEYLYSKIIEAYMGLEMYDKAESLSKEALSKFPTYEYYHALLAKVYLIRMNYFKAIEQINKAIKLSPNEAYLFYMKAVILNDKNDYKDARKFIEKALEYESNNVMYLNIYSTILYNIGDKKYKKVLDDILAIDPNNTDAIYLKGLESESFLKKQDGFLKALKINPFSDTYKEAFKNNKRDMYIFISSMILAILNIICLLFISVPDIVKTTLGITLLISIIHLAYYLRHNHLLIALSIFPYFIDMEKVTLSLVIISIIISIVIGFFLRNIATFLKSILLSIEESFIEAKNTYKYLDSKDIPLLIKSNILKIVLIIMVSSILARWNEDLSAILFLAVPFFVLVMKKEFGFFILLRSFILLYIVMLVFGFISNFLGDILYLNIVLAILMGIVYSETIRRIA